MATMPAASIYPQAPVGFDSITSQIERKLLKRGFQFNIICVGESIRLLDISASEELEQGFVSPIDMIGCSMATGWPLDL